MSDFMDFDRNGFRIHYGEHTGVWWVESIHGSLSGLKFRTREDAIQFVDETAASLQTMAPLMRAILAS